MKSFQIVQGFQKCNKKQHMMCRVAKNLATQQGREANIGREPYDGWLTAATRLYR